MNLGRELGELPSPPEVDRFISVVFWAMVAFEKDLFPSPLEVHRFISVAYFGG